VTCQTPRCIIIRIWVFVFSTMTVNVIAVFFVVVDMLILFSRLAAFHSDLCGVVTT